MNLHLQKFSWFMAALCLPCFALASDFLSHDMSVPALNRVSEAYLAGDFKKMTTEMKSALMAQPNDPLVKENVLSLMKKAYETRGQQGLPADWHLPDEITKMKITVHRGQKETAKFYLKVYGNLSVAGVIKQLRVTRYPDQVVLDKQAGVGEFDDSNDPVQHDPEFNYESKKSYQPVQTGLYLLRVELTNGKSVDGWFIVDDDMNATESPDVLSPGVGEVYGTANPTFRWTDFKSPQYKPYELRAVWMGVSTAEPPNYDWNLKWELYANSPTFDAATLGGANEGMGANKLEKGHYNFVINYHERKRFGDVLVGRDCVTSRPFVIRQ